MMKAVAELNIKTPWTPKTQTFLQLCRFTTQII